MYRRCTAVALSVLPLAVFSSCDNGTAASAVDYSAALTTMTDDVVVPEIKAAASDATALVTALKAFDASPTATTLATAQTAWRTVRADWRKLDGAYFGPVVTLGIDEDIDASPADAAGIEAAIAGTATLDDAFVENAGGFTKGFLGDEYLLFSSSGASAALTTLTGADGERRRTLAISIADEIASDTQLLLTAWTQDSGSTPAFATQVKTAGTSTSPTFTRQLTAMDAFANGIAYALDSVAMRVRASLGGTVDGTPDPSADPTSASDSTVADLSASLSGVQALWAGQGFVSKVTSTSISSQATSQQTSCLAAVTAIPAPFDTTLTSKTTVVQAAYTSCDTWKKTFTTNVSESMGLAISPDNDGD